jgi:hypothetical protein
MKMLRRQPQIVETLQLRQQLLGSLGAGFAAVEYDNVTELTLEGAPPGKTAADISASGL